MNLKARHEDLESRIKDQFPAVFITLVSVLIGLVLADLVAEARARMVLWPLNLGTLRTWFELATNGFSALVAWIVYSHIGMSRRHVPDLADAIVVFLLPISLLFGTSFVGGAQMWPWFYFASYFLLLSFATTIYHVMRLETELATFRRILRADGVLFVFGSGVPFYLAVGWADQHHHLSPLLEVICAAGAAPSALMVCHMFLRDWRYAVRATQAIDGE